MPGLARQPQTESAQAPLDIASDGNQSAGAAREANGQASDAALRRMMEGQHEYEAGGPAHAKAGAATLPKAGDSGFLTVDSKVKVGDQEVDAPKGTVVDVVGTAQNCLTVKLWSTFGGKEGVVPVASFKSEPGLTHKEDPGKTDEPDDYSYASYKGVLWNGTPKATDVAQGYIGDCYLISAMGAVAAADPHAIMKLFSPARPEQASYAVTLYLRDGKGGFEKHTVTVDTNLPSKLASAQKETPVYGQLGKDLNDKQTPMWPALLEKAYAELLGGYDQIGKGGYPERAMEAFTGVASQAEDVPQQDADVVTKFKEFQKAGEAVVCGTLDSVQMSGKTGFTGQGDGPYNLPLTNPDGDQVELVAGSLTISDEKKKAPTVTDDGNGGFSGAKGTVGYGWGATANLTYDDGKGPGAPADLRADYQWRGQLDKSLDVYANHAYMFESVTSDNKLVFKNPWGVEHPQPITAADFKRLFIGIDSNGKPKPPANPGPAPGKKH